VAGSNAPGQALHSDYEYIYLRGDDVQEGKEYLLLRHMQDPNRYESFPGQLAVLNSLGEMYQDLGRAKVLYMRNKIGVAQIESSCSDSIPGDLAVPFQERPQPEFKHTDFEQFAAPNGKTTGKIVMGRDLDTFIGAHRIVYLNLGEAQGVKPGDYFRITRDYRSIINNPTESLAFEANSYDDTQKDAPKMDLKSDIGELPRRSVGELMVLSTTSNSATALTTRVPEYVHLGDGVEMIDATALPPPAPAAVIAPPQPPTINCSASRPTIQVGENSNITCNATAEEGHTLSYNYTASSGQISGRDRRATLTASAPGPITVTATAVDDRNLSAQATVNVDVEAPAAPEAPAAAATPSLLNELTFKVNSTYVDNRAKAVLDDDALRLQRDATSTLALEGSANPSESEALALQRAENAKTYLTRSKGIDPSRIQTRAAQSKTGAKVGVILVPAGASQ
jgi:outer membrane protein OmpA-like peptidoglycan-associated protein